MAWCLIKSEEDKFRQALLDGKIDPFELEDLSSAKRRAIFEQFVDPENAMHINALYESKLLLPDRIAGYENWAKRALGMKPAIKQDIVTKINRLNELGVLDPDSEESFKEDLARTRLGFAITFEEAKQINTLGAAAKEAKDKWEGVINDHPSWVNDPQATRNEWFNNPKRLDYGFKQVPLLNYVKGLKESAKSERMKFNEDAVTASLNVIRDSPMFLNNLFKSLMASIDNSFWGRQGIKNLLGSVAQKRMWSRNFLQSFKDIKSELFAQKINGLDAMDLIKVDVVSRPNAISGKYRAGNYQLDVENEETIPTSLPGRIPWLGRVFKASETAFAGGALRMRADLADMFIAKMEAQGLNPLDPAEARGVGHLVGSLTGRGSVNMTRATQDKLNFVFWSFRFLKSNIDTLTAHKADPQATSFVKAEARKSLVNIVAQVAGILMLVNLVDPELVDEDPRSTNFGKIKILGKWVDITGGMAAIVRLATNTIVPSWHNGEPGIWKKSSTGSWVNLVAGQYGQQDAFDIVIDGLFANKLSPVGSIIRDALRGKMFGGTPFDIQKSIVNSTIPLSIQSIWDVKDEKAWVIFGVIISETFGFGVSTYKYETSWNPKSSDEMKQFLEEVGSDKFKDANNSYNRAYNIWFDEVQETSEYKKMSDDDKKKLQTSAKEALKTRIFDEYDFIKAKNVKTLKEREAEVKRKELLP